MITRRQFFGRSAAVVALPMVPAELLATVLPVALVLYGDGVHDDTAALNAWGAGKPIRWADGREVGARLENGCFLVRDTIRITRQDPIQLISNYFKCEHLVPTKTFSFAKTSQGVSAFNMSMEYTA